MTLSGDFITRHSLGGSRCIQTKEFRTTFVHFSADSLGLASYAAVVKGICNAGGSLYDADKDEYVVGTMDQLLHGAA